MKKKMIFTGLFLVAILAALSLLLSSTKRTPTSYVQADVKELRERIKHLEQLTATLEKKLNEKHDNQIKHATFTPDGKALVTQGDNATRIWQLHDPKAPGTLLPAPVQPAPALNSPAASIPPGWKPHEFNGMTYYVVPLTTP